MSIGGNQFNAAGAHVHVQDLTLPVGIDPRSHHHADVDDAAAHVVHFTAPPLRTDANGFCTFLETGVAYVTSTPLWQTSRTMMRVLSPKYLTIIWAVSIGDARPPMSSDGNHLHSNGTKNGSNVQEHAPSNSNVSARLTKHFVSQSYVCEFYSANQAATILVGPDQGDIINECSTAKAR